MAWCTSCWPRAHDGSAAVVVSRLPPPVQVRMARVGTRAGGRRAAGNHPPPPEPAPAPAYSRGVCQIDYPVYTNYCRPLASAVWQLRFLKRRSCCTKRREVAAAEEARAAVAPLASYELINSTRSSTYGIYYIRWLCNETSNDTRASLAPLHPRTPSPCSQVRY